MDEHIRKFHQASNKEIKLMFEWAEDGTIKKPDKKQEWPCPSSDKLWFDGLKKWGKKFARREYELRGTNPTL